MRWPVQCSLVAILTVAVLSAAHAAGREKKPPVLTRVETLTYTLNLQGREVGGESVKCSVYDNNTIVYNGENRMELSAEAKVSVKTEMVLDEETRFLRTFHMSKDNPQNIEHEVSVDMFANVAVMYTRVNETDETLRIVLPIGTAIIDGQTLHLFNQLVFWYNLDVGGPQVFNTLDATTRQVGTTVLRRVSDMEIEIMGEQRNTTFLSVTRQNIPAELYVDESKRIVKAVLNSLEYVLTDYSEETVN